MAKVIPRKKCAEQDKVVFGQVAHAPNLHCIVRPAPVCRMGPSKEF